MATLEEVADTLSSTLQEDTEYREKYTLQDNVATFDITGLDLKDFATELADDLNESEDGVLYTFTFNDDAEGKEFITITTK